MVVRSLLVPLLCVTALCQYGPTSSARAADLDEAKELMRTGDYEAARIMAAETVAAGTWNQRWPRLLIDAQLTLGQYPQALETYQQALKRFSSSLQLRQQGVEVFRFNDLPEEAMAEQAQIFELLRSSTLRYSGSENLVTAGRYFASRGEDGRKILELFYDRAVTSDPNYVDAHIAIAELALSKNDYTVASESLERAARLDPENPQIAYFSAMAWQNSDPQRATEELKKALTINPNHIPSLLMQADQNLDREFYEQAETWLGKVEQVNPKHPLLWAYRSVIAHLRGDKEGEQMARDQALKTWPQNPHVDHLIGSELSQKYRFSEAAEAQRRALQFDSKFTKARFALAQDLLRLGDNETGWEVAEWAQREDGYNVVAYNLMNLRDRLKKFEVLRRDNLLVRMESREAKIYGTEVLDLLEDAQEILCKKYDIQPDGPIIVEIFPNQQDFAIRTFGLPGGDGFLGVCFGRVITANSPASQGEDPSNWKSVLWHEFCHVVTLSKTNNRMPRWLSEGISVYEERLKDPNWGQQMTPVFRKMILGTDLTPISRLSGAFLSPPSAMHLQLAYYESSLAVEFMVEKYGLEMLKRVLVDLGVGMPINESLARYTDSLDQLDSDFIEFAKQRAKEFGEQFDWSDEGLPESNDIPQWRAWLDQHPDNYWGLRGLAESHIANRDLENAAVTLNQISDLFGETPDPSTLRDLATVYQLSGNVDAEREVLELLLDNKADGFGQMVRLMELQALAGNWEGLKKIAGRSLDVNPLLAIGHQRLVEASEQLDSLQNAKRSLEALAVMEPVDPAGLYYKTAVAYRQSDDLDLAKRFVLKALEEAPHYRQAQQMLLDLTDNQP